MIIEKTVIMSISRPHRSSKPRKPVLTYKSPPPYAAVEMRLAAPSLPRTRNMSPSKLASSSTSSPTLSRPDGSSGLEDPPISSATNGRQMIPSSSRRKGSWTPLPLYHPLGQLALSSPLLKGTKAALPPSLELDEAARQSSSRPRRQGIKDSLADDGVQDVSETSEIAPIEKPSPRRRRGNGGAGKRRRKDLPDGDSPYPSKRTRSTRGSAYPNTLTEFPSNPEAPDGVGVSTPADSINEDTGRTERRSTRSHPVVMRRNSSTSDGTASSVSATLAAGSRVGNSDEVPNIYPSQAVGQPVLTGNQTKVAEDTQATRNL